MLRNEAMSYINQAYKLDSKCGISFTGGEPFVRYPLMLEIAKAAHKLGMWHTVITSAVWCSSQALAEKKILELRRYGLKVVKISYDSFHTPWVTEEQVTHCVTAASKAGLPVVVMGAKTRDSLGAEEIFGDSFSKLKNVQVIDVFVRPSGRAASIPQEQLALSEWSTSDLVCPARTHLLIKADGGAYVCGSTGGDSHHLRLGDARSTSLKELRRKLEGEAWFNIVTQEGFGKLEEIVKQRFPEIEFPTQHLGVCHLCQLAFGQTELGAKVRIALSA